MLPYFSLAKWLKLNGCVYIKTKIESFSCFKTIKMWFVLFLAIPVHSHYFNNFSDQGNERFFLVFVINLTLFFMSFWMKVVIEIRVLRYSKWMRSSNALLWCCVLFRLMWLFKYRLLLRTLLHWTFQSFLCIVIPIRYRVKFFKIWIL